MQVRLSAKESEGSGRVGCGRGGNKTAPTPTVTLCLPWGRDGTGSPALTLTRAALPDSQLFIQK